MPLTLGEYALGCLLKAGNAKAILEECVARVGACHQRQSVKNHLHKNEDNDKRASTR